MPDGGFAVKFDGKVIARCYAVSFDYDTGEYTINNRTTKKLPSKLKKITLDLEEGE